MAARARLRESSARSRFSRASSSRPPSRDRHPRAPRRVRRASGGAARARPRGGGGAARLDELRELARHERAVARGETGLDFYRDWAPRDRQRQLFEAQLELAAELGKPVVVHARDADASIADVLAGFDGTVVLHCFSSAGLLGSALERDYYVSFAGNVTFPKAEELREAARRVQPERLLAETDSQYLRHQLRRGRPN